MNEAEYLMKNFGDRGGFIHLIEIYPMDSAIQLLNNWGQVSKSY